MSNEIDPIKQAIYSLFKNNWTATKYTFENEKFDSQTISDPWVRLSVKNINSGQETLGAIGDRKYLRKGIIWLQIFVRVATGMQETDQIAETFRGLFEGVRIGDIRCYDGIVSEGVEVAPWKQTNVKVNFEYDQIK